MSGVLSKTNADTVLLVRPFTTCEFGFGDGALRAGERTGEGRRDWEREGN